MRKVKRMWCCRQAKLYVWVLFSWSQFTHGRNRNSELLFLHTAASAKKNAGIPDFLSLPAFRFRVCFFLLSSHRSNLLSIF